MNPLNPASGPFDLHWRLFGIDFRVKPMFWLMNLLFGYFYVRSFKSVDQHLFAYLGLWLVCAFVSVMVHELGHVTVGRLFGARSDVLLYAMGGAAMGDFGSLAPWKRILVYAAGPVFGLGLFAFIEWGLSPVMFSSFQGLRSNPWYSVVFNRSRIFEEGPLFSVGLPGMLVILNLFLNIFNLIPVIPLDGGQIMREVISIIIPRYGVWLAYGLSFLLAGAVTVYSVLKVFRPGIPYPPLDPLFNAIIFGMMAFSNLTALRSLAPEEPRRSSSYEEKDW